MDGDLFLDFEREGPGMSLLTPEQVRAVIGSADDEIVAAIIATGAKQEDVVEAQSLAEEQADIVGQGEREIRGPVMEVYVILTSRNE